MDIENVASKFVAAAMKVHTGLGPGLLESAYQKCLQYELQQTGLSAECEIALPVVYGKIKIDVGYRIDMIVEGMVLSRIKRLKNFCLSTKRNC